MFEMIVNATAENILEIIITIISLAVSYYVIPCIKNDLVPWLKERHLYHSVKTFVQAAEKMAESGIIPKADKKQMVIQLLEKQGIQVDETVDSFIESCVKELDLITGTIKEEINK